MKRSSNVSVESSPSPNGAAIKVLVVGQTPPPFHGQAFMIERLVKGKLDDLQLIHVRMEFSSHVNQVGRFHLLKIVHLFGLIARIIYHRFADGVRILYYPPAGSDLVPMYRDIALLVCTRWLFDKTIFHFHTGGVSEMHDRLPFWQRWLFRRAYFGADAAICLSEFTPQDGKRLAAKRDYVIPNGIHDPCPELSIWPPNTTVKGDNRLRMLFVGILNEGKGVMVLIEACANLAARGVPFELEVIGQWESDEFAACAERRIAELNLEKHIRFLGAQLGKDKIDAFRRANVFCFPSHYRREAMPVVLLEAAACGLPVVATRWRGIPSVVEHGKTGFLVEPQDATAMALELEKLAHDSSLRENLGRAGRAKFEREYTIVRHLAGMRRVLLETAGRTVGETAWQAGDETLGLAACETVAMAVDETAEVIGDERVQHRSGEFAEEPESAARKEAVTI
jgi:glycosyltransferase involved in cell wall biosynthesis